MHKIEFSLTPQGPFSLAASKAFIEGFPAAPALPTAGAAVRVAFSLEGSFGGAVAVLRQAERDGRVDVVVTASGPIDAVRARDQLARMFSLDIDGRLFASIGERDAIIGELQQQLDMLRPVLFPSPYEAAAWAVLSQRISMKQAAGIKARLATALGAQVEIDGRTVTTFPAPAVLLRTPSFEGIPSVKWQRLQTVAAAAQEGFLDGARLRALPADHAIASLQQLSGIGPFSAELIVIRGAGAPDVAPTAEARITAIVAERYGSSVAEAARAWAPLRSWCSVLLRVAASAGAPSSCGATTAMQSTPARAPTKPDTLAAHV
jgi:DNA-3-methyladenine glycosylase II